MTTEKNKYQYPVGDFLSGFSEDPKNPCDYELECQRLVSRGVEYLDQNPSILKLIEDKKIRSWTSEKAKPMVEFMCDPDTGQTGAMVGHCFQHAYFAKVKGWDMYIQLLQTQENDN